MNIVAKWLMTAAVAASTLFSARAEMTLWGDANCDGQVDFNDSIAISQYIENPDKYPLSPQGMINGDVDSTGDGISGNDVLVIQRWVAGVPTASSVSTPPTIAAPKTNSTEVKLSMCGYYSNWNTVPVEPGESVGVAVFADRSDIHLAGFCIALPSEFDPGMRDTTASVKDPCCYAVPGVYECEMFGNCAVCETLASGEPLEVNSSEALMQFELSVPADAQPGKYTVEISGPVLLAANGSECYKTTVEPLTIVVGTPPPPVPYLDPTTHTTKVREAYFLYAGQTTLSSGWYVVDGCLTNGTRITVSGDVNLILRDNASLTATNGINVDVNNNITNSLTIWAQSDGANMGMLTATGGAGIGGGFDGSGGTVTINGGKVTAQGGSNGAGIGGEYCGSGGTVTINGGEVTAQGGSNGAGIGGGHVGSGGTVTINGGEVTAQGGAGGAGIGGGLIGSGGMVTINGGEVTAQGGNSGAGIGGGLSGSGGMVTINGGTVNATGGDMGVGIGGGVGSTDNGTLTIKPSAGAAIAVDAGTDEGSAAPIDGSPFTEETEIASSVSGERFVRTYAPPIQFAEGDIRLTPFEGVYDGEGHGIGIETNSAIAGLVLKYWTGDGGQSLPDQPDWSYTPPVFTNVCDKTVWVEASAPGYRVATNSVAVKIGAQPPKITDVTAKQRYPWNGLVDITCKVSGIDGTASGLGFTLSFVDPDSGNASYAKKFWAVRGGTKTDDVAVRTNGEYRLLWDARADLGEVSYSNMVVRVGFDSRRKVQLWAGGPCWAETNIGAEDPWDSGLYFWWGDTVGYRRENEHWVASDGSNTNFVFTKTTAPTWGKSVNTLRANGWITKENVLAPEHDAALAHWGGKWRMPTRTEMTNLIHRCDWTKAETNGVKGYVVSGRGDYASASIFLPLTGYIDTTTLRVFGEEGWFWSSIPNNDTSSSHYLSLSYAKDKRSLLQYARRYGLQVRPVCTASDAGSPSTPAGQAGDSAPFRLDTKDAAHKSDGVETLPYSSLWDGDANATVTIAQNGEPIEGATNLSGEGEYVWRVLRGGTYTLTHTTYMNGVAGKVETARFRIDDKPFREGDIRLSGYSGEYDGGGHGIVVQTEAIPGLELRYATASGGVFSVDAPVFTNVCTATVWVEASAPGYIATTGTATVAISKATYDMNGAAWDYTGPFSYDRSEKSVSVTGLPSGVSVASYSGEAATVPGTYTAHATLAYDEANYNEPSIPDLEWEIVFDAGSRLVEAFEGVDASVAQDSAGFWSVTLTNDVFLTSGPIGIPDNLGLVTLDLNGHEITGADGQPALRIVSDGDTVGDSTFLAIVSTGGDSRVIAGKGADAAVDIVDGARIDALFGESMHVTLYIPPVITVDDGGQYGASNKASYSGVYDGEGHGIDVKVTSPATGWTVQYASSAEGPFEAEKPLYTNVVSGVETWYEVSAPGCDPVTNVATVTVTPRNLASAVLSSVRFESVEGVRTPVVELVDDLGHEIGESGYELGMGEAQNGETLLTFSGRGNYCGLLEKSIAKTSFRVTSDAEGDIRLSDYSGVYDGGGHGIVVQTNAIPGLVLRYATASGGVFSVDAPVFTNAGVATVWVEATAPGYFATTCTVTVAISKATYDMDGAAWDYAGPFSYDKSEKCVSVTGLPSGVSVESYSGGAATVPGAYTAHATLAYDKTNYNAPTIPDLEWKIVFDAGPKLVEAFGGVDASVARDSAGLWCVTLTNDVFLTSGPIEIPDNLGLVTLDLNGHEITGAEGQPALRIVPGGDAAGDSTFLAIVSAGGDSRVIAGKGADAAVDIADDARIDAVFGESLHVTLYIPPVIAVDDGGLSGASNKASYSGVYDGEGHGIDVKVKSPAAGWTVLYASSAEGPFGAEKPLCTNVVSGVETWYEVSAPGFDPVTNVATVTVTPRNLAYAELSSVRFEFVEGVRTPVVELVDDLGHAVDKSGYELEWSEKQNGGTLLTFSGRGNYYGLLERRIAKTSFRVTFDANGGTVDTDEMECEIGSYYGELPTPKRSGFVFDGWFENADFSGSPVTRDGLVRPADIVLYAKWQKRALWHSDAALHSESAAVWNGYAVDAAGRVAATLSVMAAKPKKTTGEVKLTVKAGVVGGKKATLRTSTFDGRVKGVVGGLDLDMTLGENSLSGTLGEWTLDGSRNVFSAKDAASVQRAVAAVSKWRGTHVAAWRTSGGWSGVTVVVNDKGKAKVSGRLADGTSVSGTTQLLVGERECAAVLDAKKTAFVIWFCEDGAEEVFGMDGEGAALASGAGTGLAPGARFRIDADAVSAALPGADAGLLPDGLEVGMKGSKFDVAKAGTSANPSSLKLTYTLAKRAFKGTFVVVAEDRGRAKKVKVTVFGVVLDGKGYGTATASKGAMSLPVTIE